MRTLLLSSLLLAGHANAGLIQNMTFDSAPEGPPVVTYTEDGITATVTTGRAYVNGHVHLDATEPFAKFIDFTTGGLFNPISVDIDPLASGHCSLPFPVLGHRPEGCTFSAEGSLDDPMPYIWISGFVDGLLVSTYGYYQPGSTPFEAVSLQSFGTIDLLRVEARHYMELGLLGSCSHAWGCGHFALDNVRVESVPEPSTLALALAGLVGTLTGRIRRRLCLVCSDTGQMNSEPTF